MIAIKIVYENSQKYHQKADLYNWIIIIIVYIINARTKMISAWDSSFISNNNKKKLYKPLRKKNHKS
jgi:hypothetical protein